MAGVTALNLSFLEGVTLPAGATRLASAIPGGTPLISYRPVSGGHTTVGVAAFLGFDGDQSGDWGKLIVNAGWQKAEAAYHEDRKLNPESDLMDLAALENTAGSLAKDKKFSEAVQVVTLMTKEYPTSAQAYDDLGDVYKMNSQPQPAIDASQKALSLLEGDSKLSADDKKQVKASAEKRIAELSKK